MSISNVLEKIIRSIDKLPPFPETARRVLEVAGNPDAEIGEIVKIIQYDQGVTADCLRICNSSYFGLKEKVDSVHRAVVLLGAKTLIKTVIMESCKTAVYSEAQTGYGLRPGELWRHSVSCALISQLLANKMGQKDLHELFTASLLHDIGKLVIDSFIADNFQAMFSLMREDGFGYVAAEKEYFGIDHAELGGIIVKTWNFPQSLIEAIQNHHQDLSNTQDVNIESLTALSNLICHITQENSSVAQHEGITCQIKQDVLDPFGLDQTEIDKITSDFSYEIKKAEEFFTIAV